MIDYVTASGFTVVRDRAMKLEAKDFGSVTPAQWAQMAKELDGPDVDGVFLSCTNTTQIDAIADIAVAVNSSVENIGARRLQTVMERVLDEISFTATDRNGETVKIDGDYVQKHIGDLAKNADLSRFIL